MTYIYRREEEDRIYKEEKKLQEEADRLLGVSQ